ncbi:protein translocase subunit SecD [Spongiactinospora sp. TRM90649]|uniref:protein translocase subunit SecD n=1 Tax=Spongiactinospora sp. TRM90649 TaxID=3031114 RepID=UPI0023FA2500|nr:protein translocase subunit SecD [Spongiactinospora sp. TRM90649]MDF5751996.1 protein translocase subunit SecD [Spongiactinospora sp. TRM90649]
MLLLLVALILALGGTMSLQRAFAPLFGLDLAGGTIVTLSPVTSNNQPPSQESLDLAVNIIRDRVNGTGISDAEVARSGDNIVISVPGVGQEDVVKLVGTTAELRFRQVLGIAAAAAQMPTAAPTPSGSPNGTPAPAPTGSPAATPSQSAGSPDPAESGSPGAQSGFTGGKRSFSVMTNPTPAATPTGSAEPSAQPSDKKGEKGDEKGKEKGDDKGQATPAPTPAAPQPDDPMAGIDPTGIDPAVIEQFKKLDCTKKDRGQGAQDDPTKQIAVCDAEGAARYILDKAAVVGTEIASADSGVAQDTGEWLVQLSFKSKGGQEWGKVTTTAFNSQAPRNQVAMVLDGVVISAPVIQEPINGGRAQISGTFNQESANELANQLKYGALPLKFVRSSISEVSSTLGADQLRGGLIAGGIGLALVVIYSLLYYRGLGVVSVLSLAVATILTYQSVVVLGANAGFRLSLPHIIGLVVSIGITADSFIVYFERIRDEMKEGRRSLRAAVEVAWVRARRTILIADAVMFIAALVLYFLAVGGVAGFAFAMGLTTLIDIVVVFMFTKPFVALLARLKFFSKGHKLSGLDAERMSLDTTVRTTAPREA